MHVLTVNHRFVITTETSSTMRALSGARCTDARLYILRIKIDTRTTIARICMHPDQLPYQNSFQISFQIRACVLKE